MAGSIRPEVIASSTMMAFSAGGDHGLAHFFGRQSAARAAGAAGFLQLRFGAVGAQRAGQCFQAGGASCSGVRQGVHLAAFGYQFAGLARIGEERHRRLGVDQHQVIESDSCTPASSAR
jgi:hypothetical protein